MAKETKPTDWGKILLVLILGVLIWNSWKILELGGTASRVDKYNQGVIDEMGKVTGDVKQFSEDLNEIRRFLLLPEKKYSEEGQDESVNDTEEKTGSENSQAVFALLDTLVKEDAAVKNKAQAQTVFDALLKNPDFLTKISAAQLQPGERSELQVKFVDGGKILGGTQENTFFQQPLYHLAFSAQDNLFLVQSALGEERFKDYASADFPSRLADYMTNNISAVRDKKISDKKSAEDAAALAVKDAEAQLAAKKKELDDIVHEQAFTETLASIGLKVAEKPKEENNKYFYDIVDGSGQVRLSLALEISSGMIKVIRQNLETDIRTFLQGDGSKKKP